MMINWIKAFDLYQSQETDRMLRNNQDQYISVPKENVCHLQWFGRTFRDDII